MDHKAELLTKVPNMNGWCDPAKSTHIFDTVYSRDAKVCVELGVFAGRSLIAFGLAQAKRAVSDPSTKRITYGVDTWAAQHAMDNNDSANAKWWAGINYSSIKRECEVTVSELKINKHIQLEHMSTIKAYQTIEGPVDVLHIDGNHSRWDSVRDVTMWVDRVRPGGIIYFDDEDWDTTKNAQELLLVKCKKLTELKTSNVCGVYQKHVGGVA
jgi:hypothetical protein